jgi:hypothetical protein
MDAALTQNQIRLHMRATAGPMCGEIERTADRIASGTTNRTVKRAGLQWKIEAVPAISLAISRHHIGAQVQEFSHLGACIVSPFSVAHAYPPAEPVIDLRDRTIVFQCPARVKGAISQLLFGLDAPERIPYM